MKLKMFALADDPPKIQRADRSRRWMDEFPGHHPYRCLPLAIANAYGWDVLSPYGLTITWNGGKAASDITFEADGPVPYLSYFVNGNFTHGVVTFHTGYLFRTEPGWHLVTSGPPNAPKDGIAPLTGVVETDWLPYPFTMNWQLTRPGSVRFEQGEPFCRIYPVPAGMFAAAEPEIHDLHCDRELLGQYQAWRDKRDEFMAKYRGGDPATIKQAWQKYYFHGKFPDGASAQVPHTSKLEVPEPKECRARAARRRKVGV